GGNTGKNVYEAGDGTIWIAANDRLTAYHPEGDIPDTIPPCVQLTSIELFNEDIAWVNLVGSRQSAMQRHGAPCLYSQEAKDTSFLLGNGVTIGNFEFDGITKWYGLPENLSLAYNNNYLTFNYIGITQKQSKKVKYQYKLEGIDENWSAITNRTEAPYGNLPQGNYTFKVKAMNSEGYWSNEFNYSFTIRPPWWETWWFRTFMVCCLLLGLFGVYRWRTASMRRRQKQLVNEVRKATAEIREKNQALNQQNEEIRAQKDEITTQRDTVIHQKEEIESQRDKLQALNIELEKLSIVASETDNAVIICDKNGNFEWVNRGFERLYGLTFEEYTQQYGKNIYETSSNPDFKEVVNEAVMHNKSIMYNSQFTKTTGETVWLQTTLTPIFDENVSSRMSVMKYLKKLVAIESDITKIKEAEEEIRFLYKEVTDSINYAKRIQTAALPKIEGVCNHLSDIFVLYKPKDVVSGDFYWFAEVVNQIVITVADCTGHGVPGAIMSMMGMIMLKEIVVKEYITQPDVILRKLRKEVIKALGQKGTPGEQKDGMDISLCSINTKTNELQWSGANNPLWIVRPDPQGHLNKASSAGAGNNADSGDLAGQAIFTELKADKMPIAIYDKMDNFTLHEMQLKKGDIVYLTGDGFSDQFGGPKGKKFMSKRLKELLLKISDKPMKEQQEILDKTISDWMTGYEVKYEQTDDITVLGLKI
ncbi:MAG: SpoIIE family protein phosphatase, partial [Bacteroidia bacterium]|nr:SpoIIE family protein phosphatase [Bacteroidia bacterium]